MTRNIPGSIKQPGVFVLVALVIVAGLLNMWRGQDNWWDVINYHIYNPWSLFNHRWSTDLFAAGIQGYFHPLLDVPYYLLSMRLMPNDPCIVAFLAGIPYGVLVFLAYLIARRLLSEIADAGRVDRFAALCLIVLTSVTGVSAWTQAGTTTNEITVSAIILAGVYAFVTQIQPEETGHVRVFKTRYAFLIGALFGMAASLKLTAAIYAPAMGLAILAVSPNYRYVLRVGMAYCAGWVTVFALVYGPWGWHLYHLTGNPMFPMFNNVFHSSFSAPVGGRDVNYLPGNVWQWLFYPFYWLDLKHPTVYNKLSFRDPRVMVSYVLCCVGFVDHVLGRLRGRSPLIPRTVRVLAVFCVLSYVTWLVMFSMLRYAAVIEVVSTLLSLIFVWAVLVRLKARYAPIIRVACLLVLSLAILSSTVYPDVPRIGFGKSVFSAKVPNLGKNALVILANQPMGLLAPLIHAGEPTASFIGIPSCFEKTGWCYRGFYDYGMGRQIRDRISGHRGPLYVAYYLNRMTILPQLYLFRIRVDRDRCRIMTTNATPNIALCDAQYVPSGNPMPAPRITKQRLALDIRTFVSGATVEGTWQVNKCLDRVSYGKLRLSWHFPGQEGRIHVYLRVPPQKNRISFAAGKAEGSATTGLWVRAAQEFLFTDQHGDTLASVNTKYVPCRR